MNRIIQLIIRLLILLFPVMLFHGCAENKSRNNVNKLISLKEKELDLEMRKYKLQKEQLKLKELEKIVELRKTKSDLSDLYDQLKKSVYLIYVFDHEELIGQGSAFVIDQFGTAVSNYHVFEEATHYFAISSSMDTVEIEEILDYDEDMDYVFFRLPWNNKSFDYLEIAGDLPGVGDECFAIGNPLGLSHSITKGIISAYRTENLYIQTDAQIAGGSSGGPLFDKDGKVIGITSKGIPGENLNFAINLQEIPYREYYLLPANDRKSIQPEMKFGSYREIVGSYYDIMEQERYSELANLMAEKLLEYNGLFHISFDEVIRNIFFSADDPGIVKERYKINWNTYRVYPSAENTLLDFRMEKIIEYVSLSEPTKQNYSVQMEINPNYRIIGIEENRLKQ